MVCLSGRPLLSSLTCSIRNIKLERVEVQKYARYSNIMKIANGGTLRGLSLLEHRGSSTSRLLGAKARLGFGVKWE